MSALTLEAKRLVAAKKKELNLLWACEWIFESCFMFVGTTGNESVKTREKVVEVELN